VAVVAPAPDSAHGHGHVLLCILHYLPLHSTNRTSEQLPPEVLYYGFRMTVATSAGEETLSPPNEFTPPQISFENFNDRLSVVDLA
jgi:hypothetical protein